MMKNAGTRKPYKTKATMQGDEALAMMHKLIEWLETFLQITLSKRFVTMVLIAAGIPVARIEELAGVSEKLVYELRKKMREVENTGDILQAKQGSGKESKTANVEDQIIEEIETHNYYTLRQVADMVSEKFGINITQWTAGRLLKKKGLKKFKCGSLPAKANVEEQRKFYEETCQPLMKKAEAGEVALLFLDASHFVMGCDYLGHIWGTERRYLKTNSGRKRYNVLGALDFVSKRILTVSNDTYITSTQVCEILQDISEVYAGKEVHLILDNASYQRCGLVQETAKKLNIHLDFLPPYSPNLNLIERFWKFTKGELRVKYWDDFNAFMTRIDIIIESSTLENRERIDKLIGEKVQIFDALQHIANGIFMETSKVAKNVS